MIHFTYITTLEGSDKYYVGRHSTKNLNDGYFGSGKWVRSIKDQTKLHRTVLECFDTFEELVAAEHALLLQNVDHPDNMNFNNSPVGFGSGIYNPAKSEKEIARKREYNWMRTEKGRAYFSEKNPSRKESVKKIRSEQALSQLAAGDHNFQRPEVREKVILKAKERFINNNPMHKLDNQIAASVRSREELSSNSHNFQRPEVREKAATSLNNRFASGTHPFQNEENKLAWAKQTSIWMSKSNPMQDLKNREKISKSKSGCIGLFKDGRKKLAQPNSKRYEELITEGYAPKSKL